MKIQKYVVQLHFYWYSLLTIFFGNSHFSKYKLKYGAMLLTLAVTGGCNNTVNDNPKDNNVSIMQDSVTVESDSIQEQTQIDEGFLLESEMGENLVTMCYFVPPSLERKSTEIKEDSIYAAVEDYPEFPGGFEELMNYINKNLRYPENVCVEGRVVIRFVVQKTGKISDLKILQSVSLECDKEAVRLIESMPDWIPGKQYGKNVNCYFTIPIRFKIRNE